MVGHGEVRHDAGDVDVAELGGGVNVIKFVVAEADSSHAGVNLKVRLQGHAEMSGALVHGAGVVEVDQYRRDVMDGKYSDVVRLGRTEDKNVGVGNVGTDLESRTKNGRT